MVAGCAGFVREIKSSTRPSNLREGEKSAGPEDRAPQPGVVKPSRAPRRGKEGIKLIWFSSVDEVVVTSQADFKNRTTREVGWLEEPKDQTARLRTILFQAGYDVKPRAGGGDWNASKAGLVVGHMCAMAQGR